ncbi:GNAT family N-acetyltransferase [Streptococcus dysgalactiae subsp. equisimilis]|uniref:GNAT family acetyltransferase n=1 Tax=Streptococcus dysgalactiae TaxID=1334 RepID=A0A9X9SJD8_STRDY|nr:GNAT family N-acetyltransferase [Streptococcus dysgalactiae]MCL6221168.1 GNAT family N-acetyltransferase [Streptococcus dysgalactiae subsp. equisimilis]UMY67520.1 GNAT family N-acetyltransferase [Streptococcus dysgalactiae subsp. equisimilis]VTS24853.1 GNAT family acetyltransferase [Streptococcus dysgalactiae subsp. equisimilis]VTS39838.1 GNAT family acetyltransferase [Streptococcus dysgalactiae subsp. equisimilis]VTS86599.1 GNAT family acetyltransferase [Streptococcus dysgalactiae]
MEIRQISWSDQAAFEKFQALLLAEKAAGNSFVETKKIVDFPAFVAKSKRFETQTDHPDWSTSTNYYYFLDDELVARIGCRWQLEKGDLERFGGHIGYVTRPDYRGQGIMTELLLFALECYRKRGILRVLITANRYNIASRRTIEKVGGILEDIVQVPTNYNVSSMAGQELARYWINLGEK